MENFDPKVAARVWQRVRQSGPPTPPPQWSPESPLAQMLRLCERTGQIYKGLSRQLPKLRGPLSQLYRDRHQQYTCLKGLQALDSVAKPTPGKPEGLRLGGRDALRHCYDLELRLLALYDGAAADPRHGQVYRLLASQQQKICTRLLTLLGALS